MTLLVIYPPPRALYSELVPGCNIEWPTEKTVVPPGCEYLN